MGVLEASSMYLKFMPNSDSIPFESTPQSFTLRFGVHLLMQQPSTHSHIMFAELEDLLEPRVRTRPPAFHAGSHKLAQHGHGAPHHSSPSELLFVEIRQQLIFGQPSSAANTKSYFFAIQAQQ
jgi:hypothetical protein